MKPQMNTDEQIRIQKAEFRKMETGDRKQGKQKTNGGSKGGEGACCAAGRTI
jgi:hypothetical protein